MVLTNDKVHIREVWHDNLDEEFKLIREIVDDYPYIAMDTEFPGTPIRLVGDFQHHSTLEYSYMGLKANVDILKLIQLGLTFADASGNLPTCGTDEYCVWQFNFRDFDINEDPYAHDSIRLLMESGIDFHKNRQMGIEALRFSELLMSSGVVLNSSIHWITFHSSSDFAYLLKLLTWQDLPNTPAEFFVLINIYFPLLYDIKHLIRYVNGLFGGLSGLAQTLGVQRVGTSHQAGSDSLLTSRVFTKLRELYFPESPRKYAGVLYGLEFYE